MRFDERASRTYWQLIAHDDALRERLVGGTGEDAGEHGLAGEHQGQAVARVHVEVGEHLEVSQDLVKEFTELGGHVNR